MDATLYSTYILHITSREPQNEAIPWSMLYVKAAFATIGSSLGKLLFKRSATILGLIRMRSKHGRLQDEPSKDGATIDVEV